MRRFLLFFVVSVVALTACKEDRTEMPEFAACMDRAGLDRYGALTLAPGVDGIGFASRTQGPGVPLTDLSVLRTVGVPCARATDRTACERRAFDILHDQANVSWQIAGTCPGAGCGVLAFDVAVITAGDDVRAATREDVRAAVLPIETRDEAAAILAIFGGRSDCVIANVRPEGSGWVFKKTDPVYCSVAEVFTTVSRDGVVTTDGGEKLGGSLGCELFGDGLGGGV